MDFGRAHLAGRTFIACFKQKKKTYENGDEKKFENNINTYGGLIAWLKNEKKRIRHKHGRRNEFENKILKLQNYDYFKRNSL